MFLDVAGRVGNVVLPVSRPLLPLFEAIVNSIQAIEDVGVDGKIGIKLTRDQCLHEGDRGSADITGFEITDNGIGFNEANFRAFQTSDTTFKANRGGKGIGRFVWLVAFDSVEITSTFKTDQGLKTRSFAFVPQGDGVANEKSAEPKSGKRETVVQLTGFKEKYRALAPKGTDTIAAHIVEHCLEYLIRPKHPNIVLVDTATDERIDLDDVYQKEMEANSKSVPFKVGKDKFEILHVRLYSSHIKDHMVHFCANNRAVKSEKLVGRIPDLAKRLVDENGREFVYASYVDSPLLDSTVNPERTDFAISADSTGMFPEKLTWEQIRDAAIAQTKKYLAPFTKPIKEKKEQRIERFVATEGPMYRPILKYVEEELGMIDPDVGDDELDLKLYKAYHDFQVKLRAEGQTLLKAQQIGDTEFQQYATQFEDYLTKISDTNKSDLARYVFHRRLVLDFLFKLLGLQDDGKYALEDRVHQVIFPMGATSNDVFADQHNLWLLDERLAYHKFLASDQQLRKQKPLANTSRKEPDIVVFDKACAFVSQPDGPFQTVTIIEFKRPKRTNYTDKENPIKQVREYIQLIRSGKATTPDGHAIPVSPGVHFYCYIVADKADLLDDIAKGAQLDPTPDGQGYFGYLKHEAAYIEITTYSQLLTNAKQRNVVFFDKLGISSIMHPAPPTQDGVQGGASGDLENRK